MKELKIMKALRYLLIVMGLMSVLSMYICNPPPVWFTRVRSCLLRLRKERT